MHLVEWNIIGDGTFQKVGTAVSMDDPGRTMMPVAAATTMLREAGTTAIFTTMVEKVP